MRTPPVVRRYLPLFAVAGTLAVSACAQRAALPATGLPTVSGVRASVAVHPGAGAPQTARRGTLPSHLLFLTNENGTISIYPLSDPSQGGSLATISGLSAFQQQLVVDKSGNLFVVNNGGSAGDDYVLKYAPPYDGSPTILNTVW